MSDEKHGTSKDRRSGQAPAGERKTRRPYKAPTVTEYGSIARLTHGGGSTVKEGSTPKVKAGCL